MSRPTLHEEFTALESRLDSVLSLCRNLQLENHTLREQQISLAEERSRLIEKNEMARSKVEQMIQRLKSMEASS